MSIFKRNGFFKGSKKSILKYLYYECLRLVGAYRRLEMINFSEVGRLVFVCHGNICRSPLGEAVANDLGVPSISFGLSTRGQDPADSRAIEWVKSRDLSLCSHKTTRVDQYLPQKGDLLIGMEPVHVEKLSGLLSHAPVQFTLLGLWLRSPVAYIADPYSSCESHFDYCEALVYDAAYELLAKLKAYRVSSSQSESNEQ